MPNFTMYSSHLSLFGKLYNTSVWFFFCGGGEVLLVSFYHLKAS